MGMGVGRATGVVECTQRLKTCVLEKDYGISPRLRADMLVNIARAYPAHPHRMPANEILVMQFLVLPEAAAELRRNPQ